MPPNSPDPRDIARLNDMITAADRIVRFLGEKTLKDYLDNEMLRSAVERQMEIIGEAARHISKSFRELHPELPWKLIIGQRHVLSHDYGEIQDERVWRTAKDDLPKLLIHLKPLVSPLAP